MLTRDQLRVNPCGEMCECAVLLFLAVEALCVSSLQTDWRAFGSEKHIFFSVPPTGNPAEHKAFFLSDIKAYLRLLSDIETSSCRRIRI